MKIINNVSSRNNDFEGVYNNAWKLHVFLTNAYVVHIQVAAI